MAPNQAILRKTVPLSGEQDPICPNSVFLDDDKTTTFGRSTETTTVRLLSRKTPFMISRKHASISFQDGHWTIVDHDSLNGVFINGEQISPNSLQQISPGDCIRFGLACENTAFEYTFDVLPSRRKRKLECPDEYEKETKILRQSLNGVYLNGQKIPSSSPQELRPGNRICFGPAVDKDYEFDYTFEVTPCTRKRKLDFCEERDKDSKVRKVLCESEVSNRNEPGPSGVNRKDFQENVCNEGTIAAKIQESEKRIEGLKLLLAEKGKAYQEQIQEKEKDLGEQLLQQKEVLEHEKKEQERHLMELLQDKLRDKEKDLSNQLEQQKAILLAEKEKVEKNLLKELDQKLEEKDKELTTKLEAQRDRLENILQLKVSEHVKLQAELDRNKVERERMLGLEENEKKLEESLEMLKGQLSEKEELLVKQQEVTRKAEEMAKKVLVEQMEDEFTCIICQELFIQATTLVCSHSFCDFCLKSWLKKNRSCPICRTDIRGTFVRSIVLDSAVEKIVQTMDDETRERRQNLTQERKRLGQEVLVIKDSPPGSRAVVGNHRNPIVVPSVDTATDDVQIVERRIPPANEIVARIQLPSVGVVTVPQSAAAGVERHRRRPTHLGSPYRGHHHDYCYVCGKFLMREVFVKFFKEHDLKPNTIFRNFLPRSFTLTKGHVT